MSDLTDKADKIMPVMESVYRKLEERDPESPLLELARLGSDGWEFTNEFSARYPKDIYKTPGSAQLAYAEDLDEALWKSTHAFD